MNDTGEGAPIRATVKWFNTAKGFGFVTPADGSPEAFLHLSALRQAGYESIGEGSGLTVELSQSPKGRQVARVVDVDAGSATPARGDGGGFGDRGDRGGYRDRDRGGFGGDRGGFGGPRGPRGFGGGDRGGFGGGGGGGGYGGGDRGGFGGGDRGGFGGGDRGGFGGGERSGGGGTGYQAPSPADIARAEDMDGVVKWFSAIKGYGFIQPNSGGKDVFLHITVLRNAGIQALNPGQAVRMKVLTARKGPEAVTVELG
jgi:CspA family cold shock protein